MAVILLVLVLIQKAKQKADELLQKPETRAALAGFLGRWIWEVIKNIFGG